MGWIPAALTCQYRCRVSLVCLPARLWYCHHSIVGAVGVMGVRGTMDHALSPEPCEAWYLQLRAMSRRTCIALDVASSFEVMIVAECTCDREATVRTIDSSLADQLDGESFGIDVDLLLPGCMLPSLPRAFNPEAMRCRRPALCCC